MNNSLVVHISAAPLVALLRCQTVVVLLATRLGCTLSSTLAVCITLVATRHLARRLAHADGCHKLAQHVAVQAVCALTSGAVIQ